MRPEIKELWVERLRSGRYTQGYGTLNQDEKQCCLGVLCELAVEEGATKKRKLRSGHYAYGIEGEGPPSTSHPPRSVVKWADLGSDNPVLRWGGNRVVHNITYFNDVMQLTFNQLADLIEEQL